MLRVWYQWRIQWLVKGSSDPPVKNETDDILAQFGLLIAFNVGGIALDSET